MLFLPVFCAPHYALASPPSSGSSIIKSGKSLNQAGTPVLGRAQRVPAGTDAGEAPPTVTKELRALMADLKLEDASEMKEVGVQGGSGAGECRRDFRANSLAGWAARWARSVDGQG